MYLTNGFDKNSIMKYDLPGWMFLGGERSPCFTGKRNIELSDLDKQMMGEAYPTAPEKIHLLDEAIREYDRLKP